MDITLKVSVQPPVDLPDSDADAARHWLAEEIRTLTGITVEGYDDADGKAAAEYEVTAISFVDG
jgi:hypothetical protein